MHGVHKKGFVVFTGGLVNTLGPVVSMQMLGSDIAAFRKM